jgi:Protein of unknown function (DUF5132)
MALFEETFSGWGTTLLIGAGVALAVPILFPAAGVALRPVAKTLIEGGMALVDALQEAVAEGSEQFGDLVAEVKAERAAAANAAAAEE